MEIFLVFKIFNIFFWKFVFILWENSLSSNICFWSKVSILMQDNCGYSGIPNSQTFFFMSLIKKTSKKQLITVVLHLITQTMWLLSLEVWKTQNSTVHINILSAAPRLSWELSFQNLTCRLLFCKLGFLTRVVKFPFSA